MKRATIRAGTAREFFERGRRYAWRADAGKRLPKSRLVTFEDFADYRDRLMANLRADSKFAAEYLNSAAEKGDHRAYVAALKNLRIRAMFFLGLFGTVGGKRHSYKGYC